MGSFFVGCNTSHVMRRTFSVLAALWLAWLTCYDAVSVPLPPVEKRPAGSFKLFVKHGAFPLHDG